MMKNSLLNKKIRYTYSDACVYLVLANVLFFILTRYTNLSINGTPLIYWMSLIPGFVNMGWVWQFVTYMFVHASFSHLFFNMFALFMFGRAIERALGTGEFLLFYFLCGILSGVFAYIFYLIQGTPNVVLLGASGAIYALLFLSAVLFPTAKVMFFYIVPMKMPYAVMIYIAIEIFSQVYGLSNGIAHMVHLAGIAVAWLYALIRFRLNPIKVWKEL